MGGGKLAMVDFTLPQIGVWGPLSRILIIVGCRTAPCHRRLPGRSTGCSEASGLVMDPQGDADGTTSSHDNNHDDDDAKNEDHHDDDDDDEDEDEKCHRSISCISNDAEDPLPG